MSEKQNGFPKQHEAYDQQVETVRAALETMHERGASYIDLLSTEDAIALGEELESEVLTNTDPHTPGVLDSTGRIRYNRDSPIKSYLEQSLAELVNRASQGAIEYSSGGTAVFITPSEESTDLDWHTDAVAEGAVAILTLKNSADFYYYSDDDKKVHAFTAKPGTLAFVRGNTYNTDGSRTKREPIWHKVTKPKEQGARVAISLAKNNYASQPYLEGASARRDYASRLDKIGEKMERKTQRFGGRRIVWDSADA